MATATHIPYTKLGNGNFEYLFQLTGLSIKVANVRFNGAKDLPEPDLVHEAKPLLGQDYSVASSREFAANSFVPYYRERGFLKVKVGDPSARLLSQETSGPYKVEVEYPVTEGIGYRWDAVQWQGNRILSADRLTALMALTTGEPANIKKIESSWENVRAEYGRHGYVQANLRPNPLFDDANRNVHFQVLISEGEQFHMGKFSTEGFSPALAARLQSRWMLKSGEIFDTSYLSEFLKKELGSALANSNGRRAKISSTLVPSEAALTVDVVLLSE